jgi:hypothetical protein
MARQPLGGLGRLIFRGFTITLYRHTTLGRTPLDEGPARRRDLYLTTHNTHKRHASMPPVGFEPTILVSERDGIKISTALYGPRSFITAFTTACQWTLRQLIQIHILTRKF